MLKTDAPIDVSSLDRARSAGRPPIEVRYDLLESYAIDDEKFDYDRAVITGRWGGQRVVARIEYPAQERVRCGVLTTCGGVV